NQGNYVVRKTVAENVVIPAAPGSNSRIDVVYLQVRDPDAGGSAGDDAIFGIVSGTAAASPVAPALPSTAIELARVTVASGTVASVGGPNEAEALVYDGTAATNKVGPSRVALLTGPTPGSPVFTQKAKVTAGATGQFARRELCVVPL